MRVLVFFFLAVSLSFSIGLFERNEDPAKLEIQIIEKILTDMMGREDVRVVLLGRGSEGAEEKIYKYSKRLIIVRNCAEADVLLLTGAVELEGECRVKPAFSLDRKSLKNLDNCVGAFYWKKGRPNIIFLRERLIRLKINLPSEYNRFIESFRGILSGGGRA